MDKVKKLSHDALTAGANAAMNIFDRVDKTKKPVDPALHRAELKDERDIEYFLKKLEELEVQYRKTVVHVYDPEGNLVATLPTKSSIDQTDLSEGLSTMRNTLNGMVNKYKKVNAEVAISGLYYSHKEGHD